MSKWRRFAGLFALMAALTFAIAACGGGDDEGAGATTEAGGGTAEKTFPEFKIAFSAVTIASDSVVQCPESAGVVPSK